MKRFKTVLVVVLFFSAVIAANAQISSRETGSLRGTVLDAEGSTIPGVNLTMSSPAMMGTATDVSREDGAFRFALLPPGKYVILAELKGFKSVRQENIEIRLGATITLTLTMPMATVEEEITVVGAAPTVDVKSSKTEVLLKSDLLQNLPIGRNLQAVITLTPGTVSSDNVKGGTAGGNTYQIDGLNANDPTQQQPSIPINFNLMDEVEVITGGMPAEVGTTSGGFINVVTKSGGNKFSGLAQVYYTDKNLTGAVLPAEELSALGIGKPAAAVFNYDFSGSLGGPILKDKLWFFLDGRYGKSKNLTTFIPFTDPFGHFYDNNWDLDNYNFSAFLKLTYQLSKSIKFSVMGNLRRAYNNIRDNYWWCAFDIGEKDDPWANDALTAAMNWVIDSNTFLELRTGYANVDAYCILTRPELTDVTFNYDEYTGYYFGTGYRGANEWTGRPSYQVSAHLTRFQDNFLGGDHELKAGVEVQTGADSWAIWKNNPLQQEWYNGDPYVIPYWYGTNEYRPWVGDGYIGMNMFGPDQHGYQADANFLKLGFYFQDSFTIENRLTVNFGVRYDHANGWLPDIHHAQAGGWAYELGELACTSQYGFNPFAAFDMKGADNVINWGILAPRIGLTYDLFGDGKTALKFHYGIYGDNIWASLFERIHPLRWNTYWFYWWDDNANGLPDAPSQGDYYELDPWTWAGTPDDMMQDTWIKGVAKNIKAPYDHQIVAGIDHELLKNFKVGLSYMYKVKKNMIDDIAYDLDSQQYWYNPNTAPGNQFWVPFTTTVPAAGSFPAQTVTMYFLSNDAPANTISQVANVAEAFRKYSGLEFTFEKRMADGWQLGGSFNYSKTWGNMGGGYGDIHATTSAGDNANWFVNAGGRTNEDRPIVIKLFGSFNIPFGFLASFYYQAVSGTPWARAVTIVAPQAWAEANNVNANNTYYVPLELNGTRRNNTWQNLDFRLEKEFKFGSYGKVGIFADVFNLLGNHYININQNPGGTWVPVDNNSSVGKYTLGGTYKKITGISQLTRTVRLSVRYTF
ncbi:MAG: TonB-dependent receptor [Candidatus Aminicenantes bacterium]|nr:TonB-dependent receptor [Candidatus Aminicenantes bacterium]